MTEPLDIEATIAALLVSMREKLGVRAHSLQGARMSAKRLLPRRVFKSYEFLQKAEPVLTHPKLARTMDRAAFEAAVKELRGYLDGIDVADRRKGWWLSVAGSVAFNLLALAVLMIVVLVWQGIL